MSAYLLLIFSLSALPLASESKTSLSHDPDSDSPDTVTVTVTGRASSPVIDSSTALRFPGYLGSRWRYKLFLSKATNDSDIAVTYENLTT